VYLAPSDYHLLVEADRTLALSTDELVHHSRPSIDVLLESCADAFGPAVVGMVLTGANEDGAVGLKAIAEAGGLVMVEAPESAFAATMPAAALAACASAQALTLDAITTRLLGLGGVA
jgi:two-component system chemotaxis response regulator CheB